MKIIKPSVEFLGEVPTDYDNVLKFIEAAGRTCYKSEDKITGTSAESFVKRLIKAGHLAMVEHSNFVVRCEWVWGVSIDRLVVVAGKYLTVATDKKYIYIGGNLTAWVQQGNIVGWQTSLFDPFRKMYSELFSISSNQLLYCGWQVCPHDEIPKELHRYSARLICDRGVSHELVRHRPTAMDWYSEFTDSPLPVAIHKFLDASFAQESTRYVNYGGKDMEFIEPTGFDDWSHILKWTFHDGCRGAELRYKSMLRYGAKPQQARAVLPNALKTEIVVTADAAEWAHIKNLRTDTAAHPDMRRVMDMMPWEEFL